MKRLVFASLGVLGPGVAFADAPAATSEVDPDDPRADRVVAPRGLALVPGDALAWPAEGAPPAPPPAGLRPFAIDDTPTTIDPGHVQVEIDLAVVGYDRADGARTIAAQVMPTRVRVGLTRRLEAQLVVVPLTTASTETAEAITRDAGYGSTYGRVKLNLWGGDGGPSAAALVPFVGRADDAWTGGLAIPGALELGAGLVLGVIPQVDVVAAGATLTATANLSRAVTGPLVATAETVGKVDTMGAPLAVQANACAAVAVTADAGFDVGVRRGVVGPVPDVEGFVRVSVRR